MKTVKRKAISKAMAAAFVSAWLLPGAVMAAGPNFGETGTKVSGFLDNINGLLNLASITVVTIAVVFAGYQIAFAHKRIADVAPILIGGFLIGAAAQLAKMVVGDPNVTTMLVNALPFGYA